MGVRSLHVLPCGAAALLALLLGVGRAQALWRLDSSSLAGFTRYRIDVASAPGVLVGQSQLEFLLPTSNLWLGLLYRQPGRSEPHLEAGLWGGVGAGTGRLRDSDWFYQADGNPGVDIHSESDLRLNGAWMGRVQLAWAGPPRGAVAVEPLVGFLHQDFQLTAYDTRQVGYGPYASYTVHVTGPALHYRVSYRIPYLGVRVRPRQAWWELEALLSPAAFARDRDDHMLREEEVPEGSSRYTDGKMSQAEAAGTAWSVRLGVWLRTDRATWTLRVGYTGIQARGWQRQWWYYPDGTTAPLADGIPIVISSGQLMLSATLEAGL